jgi:hypothetical protein
MSRTINDMIRAALSDAEDDEESVSAQVEPASKEKVASAVAASEGHEKLAATLEFIGRRGVASFVKTAEHMGHGNVGTNAGQLPGGGAKTVDLGSTGTGTHHPALASNQAAIDAKKSVKSALKKVLDATPFADGGLKKNLDCAKGGVDKNINKTASSFTHDAELLKAALAKKLAERETTVAGVQ